MNSNTNNEEQAVKDNNNTCDTDYELSSAKLKNEIPEAVPLETQVAGHTCDKEKRCIGMMRDRNGHVLKAVNKPELGDREIDFYTQLQQRTEPIFKELRQYVPKYYGTKTLSIDGRCVTFLELKDIAEGMAEPCIMDIKIGKMTWDPLAGPEKRAAEKSKYAESKKAYSFCIPGFQVYQVPSGELKKYDKEYGKSLNKETVIDALEIFLNGAPGRPPCRELIMELLSILWKISTLLRAQKRYRLYSSSLLVAYDAKQLRHFIRTKKEDQRKHVPLSVNNHSYTFSNLTSMTENANNAATAADHNSQYSATTTNNNGSPEGSKSRLQKSRSTKMLLSLTHSKSKPKTKLRVLERSISLNSYEIPVTTVNNVTRVTYNGWDLTPSPTLLRERPSFEVNKLCRTHSYDHNFDVDMEQIKEDYAALLADFDRPAVQKDWVRVNMIDFTHVFPAENNDVDKNYLEGFENFVKLLESFLKKY